MIVAQRWCEVPILSLMANPFDLLQGDLVVAKITATNTYGTSAESVLNTEGALIEVVPHKPPTIPRKGWATNENVIEIFYDALTGVKTGGSSILSYVVLWDQGLGGSMSVLRGVSSPNLALTVLLDTGITSGTFYKFQYYGVNQQGDGVPSDVFTIRAVTYPSKMNMPVITYGPVLPGVYTVTFSAPSNKGAVNINIAYYEIMFMKKDGSYAEIKPDCDGADPTIVSGEICTVPLSKLTDAGTFGLVQGDRVVVKIRATNEEPLTSVYSNPSTSDTFVVALPHKPPSAPIRNEAMTTRSLIRIDMPVLTGALTGGLPITGYKLEWNGGGDGDVYTIIYEGVDSFYSQPLTTGTKYKFRYSVKNELGYSLETSPVLVTYGAKAPDQMMPPQTEIYQLNVRVFWTAEAELDSGGIPLNGYGILIRTFDD